MEPTAVSAATDPREPPQAVDRQPRQEAVKVQPGRLVSNCKLDLPGNDIVEKVDFERFFRMQLLVRNFPIPMSVLTDPALSWR